MARIPAWPVCLLITIFFSFPHVFPLPRGQQSQKRVAKVGARADDRAVGCTALRKASCYEPTTELSAAGILGNQKFMIAPLPETPATWADSPTPPSNPCLAPSNILNIPCGMHSFLANTGARVLLHLVQVWVPTSQPGLAAAAPDTGSGAG